MISLDKPAPYASPEEKGKKWGLVNRQASLALLHGQSKPVIFFLFLLFASCCMSTT
jgi:hypothetical protein